MKKTLIAIFIIYTFIILLVGRNLGFLPVFFAKSEAKVVDDTKKSVVEKFIKEQGPKFSIYYKNLKTGASFGVDENKILTAASLNKILIASYLYNQADRKKIDLEEKITIQEKDLQDYGTGSIRYEGAGGVYTLKTLAKLALEQSDNTAAFVLSEKLGRGEIEEYGKSLGLVTTNIADNKTSAKDMGILLELIFNRKIANNALTLEFLDFMKDTDFEDRLARDLPKSVAVYHKAADGISLVHDAGIIGDENFPFILSILTNEVRDEEEVKKTIGQITKFIYDGRTN
ncbi:MAG: hypothetical protein COU27_02460 [Candidatus Levybacteria bacterium CG10_big_fil_rev_8_21_14_0_10_36_7]|nr:MAG: hypothetical protein COU27_02460 [Candidatus Levybacteria bacterium CG10_big_fil_rev_8_21_14_0_10_36_7]